jgi:hypothetical protein
MFMLYRLIMGFLIKVFPLTSLLSYVTGILRGRTLRMYLQNSLLSFLDDGI